VVRNPIYLGMFGLMVATGLAYTTWWALLAAVILFLSGNRIRIRSEEKLLRETFGVQFDEYASRVRAFFPAIFNYFRKYSGSVIIRFITYFMLYYGLERLICFQLVRQSRLCLWNASAHRIHDAYLDPQSPPGVP